MDYETIIDCFVAVFIHYKDDSVMKVFVINEDRNDFVEFTKFLSDCSKNNQWHISYNGLEFDAQITQHVMTNTPMYAKMSGKQIAQKLYKYAQETISRKDRNEFVEYAPSKLWIKQIDLFKMNHWDNRAKMSSLKWIQYSMDWDNVEEMPHPHYVPVETDEQLEKITSYCINDVMSTKDILKHSKEQIMLRQTLTKEYGIDLYSASEPRISKELFLHFLHEKLGWNKYEIKQLRTPRPYIILADCILPYVQFKTPEFKGVLDYFRKLVITSTKDGFKHSIQYRGVQTDYGLGGIHGATSPGIYKAKAGWTIVTSDVTSFYPNLAIKNGFHPEQLPKKEFCELYEWIFEERKKIPKTNIKNYVFKIILNSTYGLTGDENSFLYDPRMTMQITINGQLLLSMLYEMISEEIPDSIPLMQNTDGLETMIPTAAVGRYMDICSKWEQLTQLNLEHDHYSKMVIRDVNNYIAVSVEKVVKSDPKENLTAEQVWNNMKKSSPSYRFITDGTDFYYQAVKCKGAFEWEDLAKRKVSVFHKNKSFLIIPKAIHAYFVNNIKPEDYLATNQDIVDYCAGVKAKGGWHFEEQHITDGTFFKVKLQKIVRYHVSKSGGKIVKCHPDGREIQVESGPWLQTVVNRIDKKKPFQHYDLNLKYYLEEIYKQIEQMEKTKINSYTQLSLIF